MSIEAGLVIDGKYRIVRLIGEGGMGAVYEGENVRIRRRVAIKVLHPAFTNNTDVMQRFEREAQAAGHIGNDHILEVLDLGGLPDGGFYMVMEYLEGEPLSQRIRARGRMTPQELAPLAVQILRGLGAAHGAGIVHRDLKPDNIFVLREKAGRPDYVKIIDFGISKFQALSTDGMKMTRTGAVMGTPYYMSPEQASGSREADARSDLYAIGVILYEAVTGQVPYDATTFNQLLFKIVLSEPPLPRAVVPELDPGFESIVLKAMARDTGHRFQTADEFARAITNWQATGAGVTIPPPATAEGVVQAPAHPLPAAGAGAMAPRATAGSWATSRPGVSDGSTGFDQGVPGLPKKGALPLILAAAFGGLALIAIVIGVVVVRARSNPEPAASAENPASVAPAAAEPSGAESPATASPEPKAAPPEPSASAAPDPEPQASAAPAARSPAKPSPARPAPKPAPANKPKPPRPSTDFGY